MVSLSSCLSCFYIYTKQLSEIRPLSLVLKLNLAKMMPFCSLLKPRRKAYLQSSVILKTQRPPRLSVSSLLSSARLLHCKFSPPLLFLFHRKPDSLLNNGDTGSIVEDPLEKVMATHSGILARRIPWAEEGYTPEGGKESDTTEATEPTNNSEKAGFFNKCSPFGFPACRFFQILSLENARCSQALCVCRGALPGLEPRHDSKVCTLPYAHLYVGTCVVQSVSTYPATQRGLVAV